MPEFDTHRFGSSPIQVLKLIDRPGRHDLREVAVTIECSWTNGAESQGLPHETLVRTVYAIAKDHPLDQIRVFAKFCSRRSSSIRWTTQAHCCRRWLTPYCKASTTWPRSP